MSTPDTPDTPDTPAAGMPTVAVITLAKQLDGRQHSEAMTDATAERAYGLGVVVAAGHPGEPLRVIGAWNGDYPPSAPWPFGLAHAGPAIITDLPFMPFDLYAGETLCCRGAVFDMPRSLPDREGAPVHAAAAFAARLDGRQLGKEITPAEEQEARDADLVIAYGYSDDGLEIRGVWSDEYDAWDGTRVPFGNGPPPRNRCHQDCPYYRALIEALPHHLTATWHDDGRPCPWVLTTDVPHATFTIYDGEQAWCRGVVFKMPREEPA